MSEITVASTTDTQDEINKVAGANPAVAVIEAEIPEKEEAKEAAEQPAPAPEPKESHSKFQRKIDKMARRIAELEAAQAKPAPVEIKEPESVEPSQSVKPTPDQYANYEEFIEALTDWKAEQREINRVQQEVQLAQQERLQQTYSAFTQRMSEFKREHDDFEEVLSPDVDIHPGVHTAIVELENGPAVAYYLGTHRDVAAQLMEMSEARAMAEVGRISATLGVAESDEPSSKSEPEEEEVPVHRASPPPRKAISQAPAPIKPLGGGNTKSSLPMDQLDYAEYRKIRDQQQKARYRR